MKYGCLVRKAGLFTLLISALLGTNAAAQTALTIGKCPSNWQDSCGPHPENLCPAAGLLSCEVTISDDGVTATATQNGKPASIICVKQGSTVDWVEPADGKSFILYFGVTSPFVNKSIFTARSGKKSSDKIQTDTEAHPVNECNKYFILHCDGNKCIPADPIVIVQGGSGLMGPNAVPAKH